jgi:predicted nucleic acid-binding protein
MILVDTSVWVEHFRLTGSPEALWLASAARQRVELGVNGLILTEILQGISSDREYRWMETQFRDIPYLAVPRQAYVLAAEISRLARRRGKTIHSSVDCMIAACAIVHDVPLLQKDSDYQTIIEVSNLKLVAV